MIFATLGALLALLQSPFSPALAQSAGPAIEGVVVRAGTNEPLAKHLATGAAALALVTKADCQGWFQHCGYQVSSNCK